ncbi:MAG: HAMP domain-containing histidine kinase [Phycisphaeraceae bacterium]|nr:MAG: HAMP domain-containing histidine kinase [Phycisphaeraceae bacterium]
MWRGISLANKCLLLFGGAVVLVVLVALTVPWLRMNTLVDEGQLEVSRAMAASWEAVARDRESVDPAFGATLAGRPVILAGVYAGRLSVEQARAVAEGEPFVREALGLFEASASAMDLQRPRWEFSERQYQYAKAVRVPDEPGGRLEGLVVLSRRSVPATRLLLVNSGYLLSAGMFVMALAVLVFYVITHKLILAPVRALRETTERVREGDLSIRSDIKTGDEFEELADTFNHMLADLSATQDQLRAINSALDLKLTEVTEMNSTLFEAAKLKGDFVASVSHELRTPLNSIIGFADLLLEIARQDATQPDAPPSVAKRIRYAENIARAARHLMDMINDLLEMAKIESGRASLQIERMSLKEVCSGLLGLMHPIADKKQIELKLEVQDDLPLIETDVKKFQQVIFNFLSNAVKFTEGGVRSGRQDRVTLRAERLQGTEGSGAAAVPRVRVSVIDTGPGIDPDEQTRVFEKFYQLSRGHERQHPGTGLGLAISKELAIILQGEIQLVSEPGHGSMFSLLIPVKIDPEEAAVQRLEGKFRGALSGRRVWT